MHALNRARTFVSVLLAVIVGAAGVGCSVEEQSPPRFTGPSEFALSVTLTASPNQLPRDGESQSVVTITARDAEGRALAGQRVALSLPVDVPSGTILSSSEVTTGADGQATVAVVAPTPDSSGNSIVITASPVGANLDNVVTRQISIRVTPSNASAPVPSFTVNPPTSPEIGELVTFNATGTTDEGVSCLDTCTYEWGFGGEATATGRIVTHRFAAGGSYVVVLTVTDGVGATATSRQTVTVTTTGQPSVSFSVSPASPIAGRAATFTATATPATNHRIVSYSWNWGDGTTSQTTAPAIQKTYSTAGTFLVRLTVRDDFGQTSEASQVVTVTTGLTAEFSNSPAIVGKDTKFDASASFTTGGATIQLYTWSWGDGTPDESSTSPTITNIFATAGNFSVKLTVTDSQGRTASLTRTVTVAPAP